MDARHDNITEERDLHPSYQIMAKVIGLDATIKLGRALGGACLYLPKTLKSLTAARREERDEKIIADHKTGRYTQLQLARKYKMTPPGIYDVLKRANIEATASDRPALHGDEIIERIKQILGELNEDSRHRVLRYAIKRKSISLRRD